MDLSEVEYLSDMNDNIRTFYHIDEAEGRLGSNAIQQTEHSLSLNLDGKVHFNQKLKGPKNIVKNEEDKKFIFANQKVLLTYKTHLNKLKYIDWIQELTCLTMKFIRLAHEIGLNDDKFPYEHTHILVDFGKPFRTRDIRKFDYEDIHPHIKFVKDKKHWNSNLQYIAKEDIENKDLLIIPSFSGAVWACESKSEALTLATKPSEVMGILTMYQNKPRIHTDIEVMDLNCFHPWQTSILDIILGKPHPRKILWIYDPDGNSGKSRLTKYLHANRLAYALSNVGGMKDFGTIVENALDNEWDGRCMIFDLPRSAETKSFYEPLEAIKNGMITSTKYVGGTSVINNPHIVVLCNFLPILENMTWDRWDIYMINKINNCLTSQTLNEVKGMILEQKERADYDKYVENEKLRKMGLFVDNNNTFKGKGLDKYTTRTVVKTPQLKKFNHGTTKITIKKVNPAVGDVYTSWRYSLCLIIYGCPFEFTIFGGPPSKSDINEFSFTLYSPNPMALNNDWIPSDTIDDPANPFTAFAANPANAP